MISNDLNSAIKEASQVLLTWDSTFKKEIILFNYSIGYSHNSENNDKPSLIYPAENLIKISKKELNKYKKEIEKEKLIKIYDQIVLLVIGLAIKHINNHKTIKGDIACCYLFHNVRNFPMSSEVKKRHTENHDIIFSQTIKSKVHYEYEEKREQEIIELYISHKGKKPDDYFGPSIYGRTSQNNDGGCYIATMVYGDYNHSQVIVLRDFRDGFLSKILLGRSFIYFYYKYSPSWVKVLRNKNFVNKIIRSILNLFIKLIK